MSKNVYKINYEVISKDGYKYTIIEERIGVSERDVYLADQGPKDKTILNFTIISVTFYNTLNNHVKAINQYNRE